MTDALASEKIEYGVTPPQVMASMTGLDFVRAIFDGRLPAPPIMQPILPLRLRGRKRHGCLLYRAGLPAL